MSVYDVQPPVVAPVCFVMTAAGTPTDVETGAGLASPVTTPSGTTGTLCKATHAVMNQRRKRIKKKIVYNGQTELEVPAGIVYKFAKSGTSVAISLSSNENYFKSPILGEKCIPFCRISLSLSKVFSLIGLSSSNLVKNVVKNRLVKSATCST